MMEFAINTVLFTVNLLIENFPLANLSLFCTVFRSMSLPFHEEEQDSKLCKMSGQRNDLITSLAHVKSKNSNQKGLYS